MIIDGTNLSTIGVIVQNRRSSRQAVNVNHAVRGAVGAWRQLRLGRGSVDPLVITLEGFIEATSRSDLEDKIDNLKWITEPDSEHIIQWSDVAGRQWRGWRQFLDITDFQPGWIAKASGLDAAAFNLSMVCPDPRAEDDTLTTSSTSGTPPLVREINVGSAPHPVIIKITGSASNLVDPTVTYRDSSDVSTGLSFTINDTLTASDEYVIDTEKQEVEKNASRATGNFSGDFFQINPKHGGASWPLSTVDVRLTASGGDADDFTVEYRKRYW